MSGVRFTDDPLVSVSAQFPLSPAGFTAPQYSESPSGPQTRPFGLRWLVEMGVPAVPASYRYCPERQIAVHAVTGEPMPPNAARDWTTISHKDGDEGPSKDYGWEQLPDFTG
jgi:putative ATP-grasp target RiPP